MTASTSVQSQSATSPKGRVEPTTAVAVPGAAAGHPRYLDSPQFHRDRAADLAAGNTAGLNPQEVAFLWGMHKLKS